ncbi:MAG: hypothetical protein QGG09_13215, partial [Pirellulaceae bacterium]|nr:hypothetical protein [Pirellulaceae bacterium]
CRRKQPQILPDKVSPFGPAPCAMPPTANRPTPVAARCIKERRVIVILLVGFIIRFRLTVVLY